jgi:FkbH-like protein
MPDARSSFRIFSDDAIRMKRPTADLLEGWLSKGSRAELAGAILRSHAEVGLPQARKIIDRLNALEPAAHRLRLGVIHTYTSDLLDPWLSFEFALQGLDCEAYHAPYGLTLQEAHPGSGLVRHQPDITVLMLQRQDLHPDLGKPISGLDASQRDNLREAAVDRLCDMAAKFRAQVDGLVVVTLLPALLGPGLGLFDGHSERSEAAWWAALKGSLVERLRQDVRASLFLDLDETLAQLGRDRFFDLRFWYSASFPFSPVAAREVARRIATLGALSKHPKAKVIVLDADNTLWGGVVGEEGINGIALGPDYPGNAYVAFQRRLLDYQQRGFILALCSKNNPADLDEVLREHPHQLLRDQHFAARRVNWEPKPENLRALAEELNLGLSSFIFVDDSDHECAAMRHELPEVEVVQVPGNPIDMATCLDRVARLEVLSLTAEDLAKTELYAQERRRRDLERKVSHRGGDLSDYLRSLEMTMRIGIDDASQLARLAQLTQKTNQFNLTTRRYNEQQMQGFIESPEWLVAHFSLADTFGDSGVVGLALIRRVEPRRAELDTFLMSCRVIGRKAESAFLEALLRRLSDNDVTEVVADYLSTPKNALVKDYLPEHSFALGPDGRYRRSLSVAPPAAEADFPIKVELSALQPHG